MLTNKEKEFTRLYMEGMSFDDMAARLGISPSGIAYYTKKYKLSRQKVKRKQKYEVDKTEFLRRYESGESHYAIAAHFGFKTISSVQTYLKQYAVATRRRKPRRDIDTEVAKNLLAKGMKQKDVADALGLPATTLSAKMRNIGITMRRGAPKSIEPTPPPKVYEQINAPASSRRPKTTSALLAKIADRAAQGGGHDRERAS